MKLTKLFEQINNGREFIDIPNLRQSTGYSCGASALQMLLSYYGVNTREKDLMKELDTNHEKGTDTDDIVKVSNEKFKLNAKRHDDASIKSLLNHIKNKIPTILLIKSEDKGDHFVLPTGTYDDGILIRDPAEIQNSYIPFQTLENNWKGIFISFKNQKKKIDNDSYTEFK